MRMRLVLGAMIAIAVGYTSQLTVSELPTGVALVFAVGKANAQSPARNSVRRTSRRTARRTSRRTNARQSIAGCTPYRDYYNCGGVYYRAVVEDGKTVYVVVNP